MGKQSLAGNQVAIIVGIRIAFGKTPNSLSLPLTKFAIPLKPLPHGELHERMHVDGVVLRYKRNHCESK
jgi:hypothetical protein